MKEPQSTNSAALYTADSTAAVPGAAPVGRPLLRFTVPGVPKGKRRHRTVPMTKCSQCGKMNMGNRDVCKYCGGGLRFVSNTSYSDTESVRYENLVAFSAAQAMREQELERFGAGAIRVNA